MAKQGSTRDRPNPRHCQSFELVNLTGRRSFGFHQGQRSAYRSAKVGYMTASSTAVLSQFLPCNTGGVHTLQCPHLPLPVAAFPTALRPASLRRI